MIYYHFAELIHRQAEKYGNRTALKHRDNATGKWLKISWREFSDKVMLTAKAMAEFGIKVQENIGVYSQNMPQCLYTDFGAYGTGWFPSRCMRRILRDKSSTSSMTLRSARCSWVSNCSIITLSRYRRTLSIWSVWLSLIRRSR